MAPNGTLIYENKDVELLPSFLSKGYRTSPILFVNGSRVPDKLASQARPNQTLLSFLRDTMNLTGSKLGCAEGGCGACTVMLSKKGDGDAIKHMSVNACLMPVLAADGCHITTVEGVGTVKGDNLHPIQRAMVDMHGSQCGFCTPGIIVAIYALFANNPTPAYLEEHLDGNLCRCTGYRPIWDAARSLCDDDGVTTRGPCGTPCRECPEREECTEDCNVKDKEQEEEKKIENGGSKICSSSSQDKMRQYKETLVKESPTWLKQPDNMFPDELKNAESEENTQLAKPLVVVDRTDFHAGGTWFKPTTLEELLGLLSEFGGAGQGGCKIVVGNTEVGIETKFKHAVYPRLLFPSDKIEPLFAFNVTSTHLEIGSCTSLSTIQHKCDSLASTPELSKTVRIIHDMLRFFSGTQIRNVACLGGNLVTASPISDMNPVLACLDAKLILSSIGENKAIVRRVVPVSEFFLKYRTVNLEPTELVEKIEIPLVKTEFEYALPFKQARRREDDISIVTAGMWIRLQVKDGAFVVGDIRMAFGGMAPKTIMASETAKFLIGKPFSQESFKEARKVMLAEMKLPDITPGGQERYRMTLTASFLYKFFLAVTESLKKDIESSGNTSLPPVPSVDETEVSGVQNFLMEQKPSYKGVQKYPAPKVARGLEEKMYPMAKAAADASKSNETVGKPTTHQSGPLHCSGEALYTDDIPLPPSTLQAAMILSSQCGATMESIDAEEALKVPGVVGVYTHKDLASIGGNNELGPVVHDEVLFLPLGEKVTTVGQVLGIVVAESLESAEAGARSVKVEYGEVQEKPIVSIEDAIAGNSYYEYARHSMERGDIGEIDKLKDLAEGNENPSVGDVIKVSGSFRSGCQEHFYLETNSTLAVPSESDTNLTIYTSSQAPTKTQTYCASTTGTPASKVVVRMKRMGGGFGGKETRSVFASCAAAVAAKLSSRPVRLTLGRDVDMSITGMRHAFVAFYEASAVITEEGVKLHAFDAKLYNNGGCALDLSSPVMDRALFHVDGCYYWPNFRAEGVPCKTVQPPHTAFRGFGGPQGMAIAEHVIDHLVVACKVPGDTIRRSNMYKVGQSTPFGMVIGEQYSGKWNVPTMWDRIYNELGVARRRAEAADFNSKNKWLQRGVSVVPTKFGIAFTAKFMNQGGALVHLYTDGTVLVSHGGTEMGQGLHTKVCQVAAQAFGIPVEDVYVNDSSTDKVANTIPTAASMSTDTYGMATLDACRQILARLEPVREKLGPDAPLSAVASAAHMDRIDLSAHGFFALDSSRCGFDWAKAKPDDYSSALPENSWKGHPFNYFTQGVVFAEVEIDVLTGNHRTLRTDIIIDVGSSINPAIDIGQVEGAFIQGMGWSTIEEVVWADDDHTWVRPTGRLFTSGPGTYKIPAFNDVPETFNVSLLENVDNPFAVHSSKAIGEPPFFLGTSVYYAIKDAVRSCRKDMLNKDEYFEMRMPATSERIRMHCADEIAAESVGSGEVESFQARGSY